MRKTSEAVLGETRSRYLSASESEQRVAVVHKIPEERIVRVLQKGDPNNKHAWLVAYEERKPAGGKVKIILTRQKLDWVAQRGNQKAVASTKYEALVAILSDLITVEETS
jgi:hypothetical protein